MRLRNQIAMALLTGILVLISFPMFIPGVVLPEFGFVAWFAFVPLFLAIRETPSRRAFALTFLSSLIWCSVSTHWVHGALHNFGHLNFFTSLVIVLLLVVFMSAYISLAPMIASHISRRTEGEMMLWLPAAWAAMEFLRNRFPFNGFPWANIAVTQWKILPMIQIADLVGIYGIIFLVVMVNVFLADVVVKLRGGGVRFFIPKLCATGAIFFAVMGYGMYQLHFVPLSFEKFSSLSVALVQGNISQDEKSSDEKAAQNLGAYREKTGKLAESAVELIIWPEAAFPWPVSAFATRIDPRLLGLPPEGLGESPYFLFGALTENGPAEYFNSAILADGSGRIVGRYHKSHLVPFGEYVPYRKVLFFVRKLVDPVGEFLTGNSRAPLETRRAKAGVLICFEDIFPEIARQEVLRGAQFLANLTNDAWYGKSSAPFQHLATSVFRAIENRRFLVRATNTGVSAVVMPTGKLLISSGIFEPAIIVSPVALLTDITSYTRLGDWFAYGLVAYVCLGLIFALRRKK